MEKVKQRIAHSNTIRSKNRELSKCTNQIEKHSLSIEKKIQLMKPATTRFDPLKDCFNPVTKLVPTNSIARVKEGNKRIDASVIAKLKAENAQKVKIAPITSFKKIEGTKSSSNEEDPFTRRRTKPKMACGGEAVENVAKQQPEKRLPLQDLVENIPLPIEKTLEDEIKKKFENSLPRPEMTWAFEDPIETTLEDEIRKKFEKSLPRPEMTWAFEDEATTVQNQEEADHQFNPTPPRYNNKRAPEPLEQEPERKKIKLTIIIERRSEGDNNRKSETYRIKRE
ncbi:unnamed protein product [Diamesa tonsa]